MPSQKVLSLARNQEWERLAEMGLPAVKALIEILSENEIYYEKVSREDERASIAALVKIGKPFLEEIIGVFNAVPKERDLFLVKLAEALGEIGDTRAVEPLWQALEAHSSLVAINYALVKLGDERVIEPLIRSMNGGSSSSARALGTMRSQATVEPFINALTSKNCEVRFAAAKALGQLGDKRAVEPLIKLLDDDKEMYACAHAAWALGELGDPRAISHIQNAQIQKNFVSIDGDYRQVNAENPAVVAYREALEKLTKVDMKQDGE